MTEKGEHSTRRAWVIVLVSLVDDIIILAVIGLALWYFKVKIPLWGLIAIGLALGAFIFVRTWAVIPSMRREKVTGVEAMVGLVGEVVQELKPNGVIRVCGEYWQAKSVDGDIETGEDVEVLKISRLNLEVKRKVSWE